MSSAAHNSKNQVNMTFNKANFHVMEQERNLLKITLEYVVKENEIFRGQIDDMRMTVKHNKELLKEYVEKITNKDKVVEKMSSTIEQLQSRIKSLEEHIKHLKSKQDKSDRKISSKEKDTKPISANLKNEIDNLGNIVSSKNTTTAGMTTNISRNLSERLNDNSYVKNVTSDFFNKNMMNNTCNINVIKSNSNDLNNSNMNFHNQIKEEKFSEFISRQNKLNEEICILKDELQFILDNPKKSKLKEKLDQSYSSLNSININESASQLNNSSFSIISTNTIKRKYNLKEKFNLDGESNIKFQEFLNSYTPTKNMILLIDSKNNVWELVKRLDLNSNDFMNDVDNIVSITSIIKDNVIFSNRNKFICTTPKSRFIFLDPEDSPKSKLTNIEIKENDNSFHGESELDISKITNLNFSHLIRDMNE